MGDEARGPEEYLPLTPAVVDIVLALGDDELYGYAIMREVRRRRYCRLADLGRRVAVAEVQRLEGLLRAARSKGLVPRMRPSGAFGNA